MKYKISIVVLVVFLFIYGSAVSEELPDALYVSVSGDLQPGWYTVTPEPDKWCKMTIVDVLSFDAPKIISSYEWFPDGVSLLSDCADQPEEYSFPLWEGCFVLFSYYGDLEYDESTGNLNWRQFDDTEGMQFGKATLKYIAPLPEQHTSADVRSFTAAPGIYSAPSEIPSGTYEISCADGFTWTTVDIFDENEKYVIGGNLHSDAENKIGNIEIKDGFKVKVSHGSAQFAPSSGGIKFNDEVSGASEAEDMQTSEIQIE